MPAKLPFPLNLAEISRFCEQRRIRKLSVFGSVVRTDFDPGRSDVDVLAEFEPGALQQAGFEYFGYGRDLEEIIGRRVDFCSRLHPMIFERVRDELLPIYERA